jgi:hypothetical protein
MKHLRAEDDVQGFADELGWPRRVEQPADIERGAVYEVAWFAGPAVLLRYAEDPVSRHSYVESWASDQKDADALAVLAQERLDAWREEELLEAINTTDPMARAVAVIRAGLASPEQFDERFFDRIQSAMSDPDRRVREAAIYATTYTTWLQYVAPLRDVAINDPDEERRNDAQNALHLFEG